MSAAKEIHTQARVGDVLVHDRHMKGKYYMRDGIRIAMLAIDTVGGAGEIRQQVVGARNWARYRYTAGGTEARQDQSIEWA